MSDKISSSKLIFEEFQLMGEGAKDDFSRLCAKLLNETFIIKSAKRDTNDFYFLLEHISLFKAYFDLIDFDVIYDQSRGLFYIQTKLDRNRYPLTKFETILLLYFRLKFYEKSKSVSLSENIYVSLGETMEDLKTYNIYNNEKKQTDYDKALRSLRRRKLIDFSSAIGEGMLIQILPSIMVVVTQDDIDSINRSLKAYEIEEGGSDDEDVEEN